MTAFEALAILSACGCVGGCTSAAVGPSPDASSDVTSDGATESGGGDAATEASDDSGASACVALINHYRGLAAAPPVVRRTDEEACATDQATKGAADLLQTGTTTFHKYFGQCSEKFQNECWYSQDDVNAVLAWCMDAFWAEGPPDSGINHYSVMIDPSSTQVACGLSHMDGGGYWMTNDYY